MPRLYGLRDGPRNDNIHEVALVSFSELRAAFGRLDVEWHGLKLPQFNADRPSKWPRHVVIEIRPDDGTDARFNRIGFFRVDGVDPDDAEDLLDEIRRPPLSSVTA